MSDYVKGRPARVDVKLPVWLAEKIVDDIDNATRVWNRAATVSVDGLYPVDLHDFRTNLAAALAEAKG